MTTLANLINDFGADAFILADAGNGCGFGELGRVADYDEAAAAQYGAVELAKLDVPAKSIDGYDVNYASEWLEAEWPGEFRPSNPYRFRVMF